MPIELETKGHNYEPPLGGPRYLTTSVLASARNSGMDEPASPPGIFLTGYTCSKAHNHKNWSSVCRTHYHRFSDIARLIKEQAREREHTRAQHVCKNRPALARDRRLSCAHFASPGPSRGVSARANSAVTWLVDLRRWTCGQSHPLRVGVLYQHLRRGARSLLGCGSPHGRHRGSKSREVQRVSHRQLHTHTLEPSDILCTHKASETLMGTKQGSSAVYWWH